MTRIIGFALLDSCFVCLGTFAIDDCFNPTLALMFAVWAVVMTVVHLDDLKREGDLARRRALLK